MLCTLMANPVPGNNDTPSNSIGLSSSLIIIGTGGSSLIDSFIHMVRYGNWLMSSLKLTKYLFIRGRDLVFYAIPLQLELSWRKEYLV